MKSDTVSAPLAAASALTPSAAAVDQKDAVDALIAKIKDKDEQVRGAAWQSADAYGAAAVKPLAGLMTSSDIEVARAAKRGLWRIVRRVGRPGADSEKRAVVKEILDLLAGQPTPVRREALWMLSEIGGNEVVQPIGNLLSDRETHEDALAALERIPGAESLAALKAGLRSAPEGFRPAIANSLRVRGVAVEGYPSQKLVPSRPKPPAAKTG